MPLRASWAMHPWLCRKKVITRAISALAVTLLVAISSVFSLTLPAGAKSETQEQVIYFFSSGDDGCVSPLAPLVADAQGGLYGTASGGGENHNGCVFELSPNGDGTWIEKTIHFFDVNDGVQPGAALVFDKVGNLYSTAGSGGLYGGGVVFELSPIGGVWADSILHNFGRSGDGVNASTEVVFGPDGSLYGATQFGGSSGCGIVYSLNPGLPPWLGWEETILHDFANSSQDGCNPRGGVVFASRGRLYGTTSGGGVQVRSTN
jgi:uncharacterized repeat protein (TIGR03803 family)